jgi:hypothetical protein
MSDFKAGEKSILYEVVKDGFRYITTDKPDGTEESIAEYRRADLPPTLEQLKSDPRVQALIAALDLAEEYWQLGALKAPLGMIQNVARTRQAALAPFKKDPS